MEQSADSKQAQQELEALRHKINTEVGTEPDCPWCGTPRVSRSVYIRCNRCGVNWSHGQDYNKDPRVRMVSSVWKSASDLREDAK